MSNLSDFMGGGGGLIVKRELFTSSGTWTKSADLVGDQVWITAIGGGSSGATGDFAMSGGNAGQHFIQQPVDVSGTSSEIVTIGSGGAGKSGTGGGNPGASTSFGALLTALGASAVSNLRGRALNNNGGSLGRLSAGNTSYPVDAAQTCGGKFAGAAGTACNGNFGAGAGGLLLDDSGQGGETISTEATAGWGYGSGGGPSLGNNITSGAGAPGAVLVEWLEAV